VFTPTHLPTANRQPTIQPPTASREAMDANVVATFERARAAAAAGHARREIVAVEVPAGRRGGAAGEPGRGLGAGRYERLCACPADRV
jgi:hypothetical protein